jgi:hypothetical protein
MFRQSLAAALLLYLSGQASTHDSWINQGSLRNRAGEWCCGFGDCGLVDANAIHFSPAGYEIHGNVVIGAGEGRLVERIDETVPASEAQPSPDGAYWRCRRPDGSRRCFFAPKPTT